MFDSADVTALFSDKLAGLFLHSTHFSQFFGEHHYTALQSLQNSHPVKKFHLTSKFDNDYRLIESVHSSDKDHHWQKYGFPGHPQKSNNVFLDAEVQIKTVDEIYFFLLFVLYN